jgi:hypothetical protein
VPAGAHLHNGGSWMFETHFLGGADPRASPYWPGGLTVVEDEGAPRVERLLDSVPAREMRGTDEA